LEPIYTARTGLRFLLEVTVEAIRARSLTLTDRLIAGADAGGISVKTPRVGEERSGLLCLEVENPSTVVSALRERGIDVDTRLGTGIRISPHPLNTEDECDLFYNELLSLLRR